MNIHVICDSYRGYRKLKKTIGFLFSASPIVLYRARTEKSSDLKISFFNGNVGNVCIKFNISVDERFFFFFKYKSSAKSKVAVLPNRSINCLINFAI